MFVEARIERFAEKLRKAAALPLRLTLWNGRQIDLDSNPAVTVRISAPSAVRYLLYPSLARLGEAYVEGYLQVEGPIREVVRIAAGLVHNVRTRLPRWEKVRYSMRHSRRRDAKAIEYHYDVSNEFYQLWLDRNLAYSCAYFHGADDSLDSAQEQKFDHICRKLRLAPGERFLDIGCGWGGLVRFATERYGCRGVGITLSPDQARIARERCRGLPVEIRLQDYRDVPDTFDRVASVGMFEHVGQKNHRAYMRAVRRALKDDGLGLLHFFATQRPWPNFRDGELVWIKRNIFPGSVVPTLSQVSAAMQDSLILEDLHNFGADYDPTLMAWFENFDRAWPRLRERYGDRFYRMWKFYLLIAAGAFRSRKYQLWQLVVSPRGVRGGYCRLAEADQQPQVITRAQSLPTREFVPQTQP